MTAGAADNTPTLDLLVDEINQWVASQMATWAPPTRLESKVVRDPLHDFVRLEPHEVGVWDTPIVQRLRYIHQTALSYLVYPGLHHTRFEHSIGVLHVADRMIAAIAGQQGPIDPVDRLHVRLAALLHDVGHVALSHLGETAMVDALPTLVDTLATGTYDGAAGYFSGIPLGECLSYLIIASPAFQTAFQDQIAPRVSGPEVLLSSIDLDRVARMVIGRAGVGEAQWPVQVINGSFDADKLDYIMRDSYASGIQIEVDTTRLIHSVRLLSGKWAGALGVAGHAVNYLEQILLAKLTLSTALYQHHKVRSIECMLREFFSQLPVDGDLPRPAALTDWLDLTEHQLLAAGRKLPDPHSQIRDMLGRRLLKRCLVLDRNTVSDRVQFQSVSMLLKRRSELELFRDRLMDSLPAAGSWSRGDLWIDVPEPPDVDREAQQCLVELAPGEVEPLSELMPADDWVRSYVANKLRGHVFYRPDDADRQVVASHAERVLGAAPYRVRLRPLARRLALKN